MTQINIADHTWIAQDDLSDCIGNIAYWLGHETGGTSFTADAVATVPVTINGFSAAQTGDLLDLQQTSGGSKVFQVATVASALNGLKLTAGATGNPTLLAAIGETNVGLTIDAKGTGAIKIGTVSTGGVEIGGDLTIDDAKNVVLGSTTGTKIGTATTQKLGFFNSTPIVQPSISGALSTVADAPAKAVLTSIIAALKTTGLGLAADATT